MWLGRVVIEMRQLAKVREEKEEVVASSFRRHVLHIQTSFECLGQSYFTSVDLIHFSEALTRIGFRLILQLRAFANYCGEGPARISLDSCPVCASVSL